MADEPKRRGSRDNGNSPGNGSSADNGNPQDEGNVPAPGTTGRYLVLLRPESGDAGVRALTDSGASGANIASMADFASGDFDANDLGGADALFLPNLQVAILNSPPDLQRTFSVAEDNNDILAIEPEHVVYALDATETDLAYADSAQAQLADGYGPSEEALFSAIVPRPATQQPPVAPTPAGGDLSYWIGYRDAVNLLVESLAGVAPGAATTSLIAQAWNEASFTWGLQATRVPRSRYTGRGIRVAVLDTGFDFRHPDFVNRQIRRRSFVSGQTAQDGHGHGTHCVGTSCGPRQPGQPPRYGVACDAEIYVGKVLSNEGSGGDGGILAGIEWAIANGCHIVSMSLGSPTTVGSPFSQVYENAARRALAAGTLIIAAAGNDSTRPGFIASVSRPANCPSIMAVGAIDENFAIASFSCGGLNPNGGKVDIAAPGVNVLSSYPRPALYRRMRGTSMATPHVAGLAALHAQATGRRGAQLWQSLVSTARALNLPTRDVGSGLVQAP